MATTITDALAGKTPSPRRSFFYFNDDGSWWRCATTSGRSSLPSSARTGFDVWQEPFVTLRLPKIFNLRSDPFETADHESIDYGRWRVEHTFVLVPAQQYVGQFLDDVQGIPAEPEAR